MRPRRPSRPSLAASILPAMAVAFTALSLWPHRHLVSPFALVRFSAFALALALAARFADGPLARLIPRGPVLRRTILGVAVFVPVYQWNQAGPPHVVLLQLDTLRADHTTMLGYERDTTPRLARLARERGVSFTRFFSQSAGTDKSVPAMLASIYPSMFADPLATEPNYRVPDRFPLLGQYLAPHGYRSWALSTNPQVSLARNYGRGFDEFIELWKDRPRTPGVLDRVRERLEAAGETPLFAFSLIIDPHSPYGPPPGFNVFARDPSLDFASLVGQVRGAEPTDQAVLDMMALYDGEILEVDAALGDFVDDLRASGLLDRTLLVVTSDHGEKFLEHGGFGHGGMLHEEVIHVPLVMSVPSPLRFPTLRPAPIYDGLASHVDLVPTIMGMLGLPVPAGPVRGRDLSPALYGAEPAEEVPVFSEEFSSGAIWRSLRDERHKLHTQRSADGRNLRLLFDLSEDPGETHDLVAGKQAEATLARLTIRLEAMVEEAARFYAHQRPEGEVDAETLEDLRALGYLR